MNLSERISSRCLIPDIYHGKSTLDKEEATHLMNGLDWGRAVAEICDCVEFLRKCGCRRVGVVGFCMGGALSLAVAQKCDVDCAVSFYGTPPETLAQPENVKVPVQLHVGVLDNHTGFSDVATIETWAGKAKDATVFKYEACGHGFLNVGDLAIELRKKMGHPEPTVAAQAEAWATMSAFFRDKLAGE